MQLLILVFLGTFTKEATASLGKNAVHKHSETLYTMGFLGSFWSIFFLAGTVVFGAPLTFQLESLPFLITRIILEIALVYLAMRTIITAERTTAAFLHSLTIPLLLIVDIVLGYSLTTNQWLGVSIIILALLLLFYHNPIGKKGAGYGIATAVLAVVTVSLYKYNITHFNSVAAEQMIVMFCLLLFMGGASKLVTKEHPLKLLVKPYSGLQSFSGGLGTVFLSFSYVFAPASVVIAAKRVLEAMWAMAFGRHYFHEGQLRRKLLALVILVIGLTVLVI